MIRLENVTKVYKGDVAALKDATADIEKGEFVFLVGPSGSGKSTCIRLLNKEETPTEGEIFVAGKDIGALPAGRCRTCAATSAASSRTSSCSRTRPSTRTSRSRSRSSAGPST